MLAFSRISPEKCKALSLTVMAEADYDALRVRVGSICDDNAMIHALFEKSLPCYQERAKPGVGRHPDVAIAFLILESFELKNESICQILLLESTAASASRRNLFYSNRLITADEFAVAKRRVGDYRAADVRKNRTKKSIPRSTRPIPLDELPPQSLVEALKKATQRDAIHTLLSQACPNWSVLSKVRVDGRDNRKVVRAFHAAGFTVQDMNFVMGKATAGDLYSRLKAMKLPRNTGENRLIHD